ncbi:RIIA [Delftia phage PhiW-14]|uniref:RIIA n=1 Tax=Delftia phage PhiW-14 TaxID=665032 RepID=C9DFX3_BPW14|nr:RIIA [Delftia phage PhiW-14]ACV50024.1 RIIA [Delftia phage PhiW-14]
MKALGLKPRAFVFIHTHNKLEYFGMIVEENQERSVILATNNVEHMAIKQNSKAVMVMVDRLYSKKREAVVRELGANAMDAHKIIGNPNPFTIIMPSGLDPNITFIDEGPGLSWDDCRRYLGTLFESSKDGENLSVGHYGLGSKSPHTVAGSYVIESRHGGKLIKSAWFRDGEDTPKFMKVSEEDWDGPTGITFRIPCPVEDHSMWIRAIKTQTAGMKPRPKVFDLGVEVEGLYDDKLLFSHGPIDVVESPNLKNFFGRDIVNMGGILYPMSNIDELVSIAVTVKDNFVRIINVPIGACLPPPHREALEDCKTTQDGINKAILEGNEAWHAFIKGKLKLSPIPKELKTKDIIPTINKMYEEQHEAVKQEHIFVQVAIHEHLSEHVSALRTWLRHRCATLKFFDLSIKRAWRGRDDDAAVQHYIDLDVNCIMRHGINDTFYLDEEHAEVAKERGPRVAILAQHGMVVDADSQRDGSQPTWDEQFATNHKGETNYQTIKLRTNGRREACTLLRTRINTVSKHEDHERTSDFSLHYAEPGSLLVFTDMKNNVHTPNQRRWLHSLVVKGVEPTSESMSDLDIKLIDRQLSDHPKAVVHRIGQMVFENVEADEALNKEIREEFFMILDELGYKVRHVPEVVTIERKRGDRVNLSGLRVLRREDLHRQKHDEVCGDFTMTPAWVPVPSLKPFEKDEDYNANRQYNHIFVYSAESEKEVYLDANRKVKVSKAWLIEVLKCFSRGEVTGHRTSNLELIRLGKDGSLRYKIGKIKEGWSVELDLLRAYNIHNDPKLMEANPIIYQWEMLLAGVGMENIVRGTYGRNGIISLYDRKGAKARKIIRHLCTFMTESGMPVMGYKPQVLLEAYVQLQYAHEFIHVLRRSHCSDINRIRQGRPPESADWYMPMSVRSYWSSRWSKAVNNVVKNRLLDAISISDNYCLWGLKDTVDLVSRDLRSNPLYRDMVSAVCDSKAQV